MKKNTVITIALLFGLIIGGALLLYGVMKRAQGKMLQIDMTNMELSEEIQQSFVDTRVADDTINTVNEKTVPSQKAFNIEFNEENSPLKREAVDMDMEDALDIALKQIEKTYSVSLTDNKVCMAINQYSSDQSLDSLKGARYYMGFIICNSKLGYAFDVNSVTGEIYSIGKFYQDIDRSQISEDTLKEMNIIYDEFTESDLEKVKDTYYGIAEDYIVKNLDEGNVVKKYDICPGSYGTNYIDVPYMCIMSLDCEMDNGRTINILIDQFTKEVVNFRISS